MVYRKTEAVKARAAATRESIIAAATAVIAKHGSEDATISRVVERAKISMGTLYTYFADIEEVRAAVVAAALARDTEAIRAAAEAGRYPTNALAQSIAAFYATLDKPRLARALSNSPAYRKGIRERLEWLLAGLDFPPRARKEHASALLGALYGLSDVEASTKTAVTFALRAIGTPLAAAEGIAREVAA